MKEDVGDARVRATSVPERAENCGHQRSVAGTLNDPRPGLAQVDPCAKRPSKQPVAVSNPAGRQPARPGQRSGSIGALRISASEPRTTRSQPIGPR